MRTYVESSNIKGIPQVKVGMSLNASLYLLIYIGRIPFEQGVIIPAARPDLIRYDRCNAQTDDKR